ncbi:hypothetical protein AB986_20285 [Alkalihalobacillus macyae]|uniref:Uncharacterized protein n=1 Tax=Guptibacillus hwajinpoensis TaxID=208199 RepID=A0A0J6CHU4_9BACL|nr:hypothetical protein AB986_20285 [Alkalihalobacillus macyae]
MISDFSALISYSSSIILAFCLLFLLQKITIGKLSLFNKRKIKLFHVEEIIYSVTSVLIIINFFTF